MKMNRKDLSATAKVIILFAVLTLAWGLIIGLYFLLSALYEVIVN